VPITGPQTSPDIPQTVTQLSRSRKGRHTRATHLCLWPFIHLPAPRATDPGSRSRRLRSYCRWAAATAAAAAACSRASVPTRVRTCSHCNRNRQPTTCNHGHHCCNHCKHQHPDPHSRCLREASQRESTNSAGFGPTTSKVCADRAWPAPSGDGHRQYHCYFCTTPGPPSSTARNLFAAALASSSHVDTTARLPLLDVGMAPLHKRTLLSATSPVWPAAAVCRFWCLCLGTHPKPSAWHQRAQLPTFVGAPFALETGTAGYKVVHAATDLSPPNTQAPPLVVPPGRP
jgi:hypothetical protein